MLSKKVKRAEPEIGKAPLFSSALLRYVFFIRLSLSGRSPALPVTFRRMKWLNMSFPISGAKVLLFFDMTKFFGKKMQLYPLFRKTTNKKSDPRRDRFSPLEMMSDWLSRCNVREGVDTVGDDYCLILCVFTLRS